MTVASFEAAAADFGQISGSLDAVADGSSQSAQVDDYTAKSVQANSPQNPVISSFASVNPTIVHSGQFDFEVQATALTVATAPNGNPNSMATLVQPFSVDGLRRVTLIAEVTTSGSSTAGIVAAGPGLAIAVGDTVGEESFSSIVDAGLFSLSANSETAAQTIGAHTGTIAGSLVITHRADLDADFVVGGSDFLRIQRGFSLPSGTATFATGDTNGDNAVDAADVQVFEAEFGAAPLSSAAIAAAPEPGSLALALLSTCALTMFRYRRRI